MSDSETEGKTDNPPPSQDGAPTKTWSPTPPPEGWWGDRSANPKFWFWCQPCGGDALEVPAQFVEGRDAYHVATFFASMHLAPKWLYEDPQHGCVIAVRVTDWTGAVSVECVEISWVEHIEPLDDTDIRRMDFWSDSVEQEAS